MHTKESDQELIEEMMVVLKGDRMVVVPTTGFGGGRY